MHVRVDRAGNLLDRLDELGGERGVARRGSSPVNCTSIAAGKPKFRICVTMSAGWKKNSMPGKRFGSSARSSVTNSSVGPMAFAQRQQDLAVERADRAGVAVREVDAAVRHAEVVEDRLELVGRDELADRRFDVVGEPRRLLDARAGRRAHVQADLAGVDAREEVAAEHRIQQARQHAEAEEQRREDALRCASSAGQRQRVGAAHALELRGRTRGRARCSRLGLRVRLRRRARRASAASPASARACATGCTTRSSRTPPPRRAARTGSARRPTGRTSARTRCRCTASRRTPARRSRRRRRGSPRSSGCAQVQVALDVLDGHDRLVDQDADREREAAERHEVERLAEHLQHAGSTPGSTAEWSAR